MIELGIAGIRPERRESGGSFTDAVVRLLESQAAGTAADASSTAAVEAASGAVSRAFALAGVQAPEWIQAAVTPLFLAQVGRDLIRAGESMHVLQVDLDGKLSLLPAASWHFEGGAHPSTWRVRATVYGPSTSVTRFLPYSGVIFCKWGSTPGQPYTGVGPLSWAHTTARLQSETERSLADEAGGPIAQLLAIPQDGGTGEDEDTDPLASLKADIRTARGKALLVETVAAGWGEGKPAAPQKDWRAERLGPMPAAGLVQVRSDSFKAVLAAAGCSVAMFDDSDGTSKREALRQFFLGTVQPLARLLETELTAKLEAKIRLSFDLYNVDLPGRAQAFQKMVAAGMDLAKAAGLAGLMEVES